MNQKEVNQAILELVKDGLVVVCGYKNDNLNEPIYAAKDHCDFVAGKWIFSRKKYSRNTGQIANGPRPGLWVEE